MPTSLNKYLDPAALDETVVNIRELVEGLEEEMQDLPYARPDGLYPDMTVGAVIGADETAQWATRESTGSGTATVRSVQGAAVAWMQMVQKLPDNAQAFNVMAGVSGDTTTVTQYGDGFVTFASSNVYSGIYFKHQNVLMLRKNHIYLGLWDVETSTAATARLAYGSTSGSSVAVQTEGRQRVFSTIQYVNDDAFASVSFQMYRATAPASAVETTYSNCMLFDLTQMFGAGNEPTAEQFMQMFPETYYQQAIAPTLKPVQIAGIASTDAQGGELDAIEWTAQTLRAAGSVADELTSDELVTRVGVVDLGTLTWVIGSASKPHRFLVTFNDAKNNGDNVSTRMSNASCAAYETVTAKQAYDGSVDKSIGLAFYNNSQHILISDSAYTDAAAFKAAMSGVYLWYELDTPTTTPISPALPMTYRVEQGGTEAIIVPDGEVSAAPVLTVAEPVNAGDEFARIWAAIQSLGYTRNTAQLSRPVSLTDIGSIDEVQKETAEIDTTKEVTE